MVHKMSLLFFSVMGTIWFLCEVDLFIIIRLLLAAFAEPVRVVRLVYMGASPRPLQISFNMVALVTHELCPVLAVKVLAGAHVLKMLQCFVEEAELLVVQLQLTLVLSAIELVEVFEFLGSNGFFEIDVLFGRVAHLTLSHLIGIMELWSSIIEEFVLQIFYIMEC